MKCLWLRFRHLALIAALGSTIALAQQQIADAPSADAVGAGDSSVEPKQAPTPNPPVPNEDKRILGVLPNYRTTDGTLPFQKISSKYKMTIALKDSFDKPNYIIGGIFAGIYQANNSHPEFGQGLAGFGRYYGTAYADQVIGNMLTEGFMPVILHEDPRYFRKVKGSVTSRLGYSLTRVFVAKTDSGRPCVNVAEILGNGVGASIANLYYSTERGYADTFSRMATQIATDSLSNVLKEFWPDIKRKFFKKKDTSLALH